MPTGSTSTPDSDSWTRSGRCARPAASNKQGCRHPPSGGCRPVWQDAGHGFRWGDSASMFVSARAALPYVLLSIVPVAALAQTGPSEPQVINDASTAKISVGSRKLEGHVVATVRVGDDGRVRDVLSTENTTQEGFEPQLVKVLQSARFRPAIDASGKLVE